MRRLIGIAVALAALTLAPAHASHTAASCTGAAPVVAGTPVGCGFLTTCTAPSACLFGAAGSGSGEGLITLEIKLNGVPIGGCGPAVGGCTAIAPFNLPPIGGRAMLECDVTGPAVLVGFSCSATPLGHV